MRFTVDPRDVSDLEKHAEHYGVTAEAVARAILHTVLHEEIAHQILAGIDIEHFSKVPSGRVIGKGMYPFEGQRLSTVGISAITGIPAKTIARRLELGWTSHEAAWTPVRKQGKANV